MNKLSVTVLLYGVSAFFSLQVAAQNEPRLFTTPELRAELERRRLGYISPEPAVTVSEPIAGTEEEQEEVIYSLEGILMKNNSDSIVWLNGRGIPESELPSAIELTSIGTKGQLIVRTSDSKEFQLLPGQVLNLTTETLYESYQWQEVLRQRRQLELASAQSAGELVEPVVVDQ